MLFEMIGYARRYINSKSKHLENFEFYDDFSLFEEQIESVVYIDVFTVVTVIERGTQGIRVPHD